MGSSLTSDGLLNKKIQPRITKTQAGSADREAITVINLKRRETVQEQKKRQSSTSPEKTLHETGTVSKEELLQTKKCFNRRVGRQKEKNIGEKRKLGKLFKELTSYNRDSKKERTEKTEMS